MATLDQKLHVKNGSTIQEVTLYTTAEEATPEGGSSVEMSINGTKGYVALWNKSIQGGRQHTPVTIKKNNIEYWLDCIVSSPIQTFTLTLLATEYQVITLDYVDPETGVTHRIMSTSSIQSVTVDSGTTWTATIAAVEGYNPGTLSASSGTVTSDIIISATEATIATRILNLSNSYYKMSDVYPNNYRTITQIPDELNSSNVTVMDNMFANCQQLTTVPDIDTSNVTRMNSMFSTCTALTSIPSLDTDQVTDMNSMFWLCTHLTTIPSLDTSSATNMGSMFYKCTALSTVPELDTSHATDMSGMFYNCSSLPTTFPWTIDCSGITASYYLANMFTGSSVTEVRLSNVKSSLKSQITSQLLKGNDTLNIIFDDSIDMSNYAMHNIDNRQSMTTLPQENIEELTNAILSSDASSAFSDCRALTSLSGVEETWNTSDVTDMHEMFKNCESLTTLDVSDWDVSNVTDMHKMFHNCYALTALDVSDWDTSNVTDMHQMFDHCTALTTLNISGWDTSHVTDMHEMFKNCESLTSLDLSGLDVSSVTKMDDMFKNCSSLITLDLSNWNTSNVTSMIEMFEGCNNLEYLVIDSSTFEFNMVNSNCGNLNTTCKILVPRELLDTYKTAPNWSSRASQFEAIEDYIITRSNGQVTVAPRREVSLYHYAVDNISDYQTITTLPQANIEELTDIVVTADASQAFHGCRKLTTLSGVETTWRTSNVTSMYLMFYQSGLTDVDFSNWDTSNVTNMSGMFQESKIPNEAFANFNTSNLTDMSSMFNYWEGGDILDLSHFDMSKVVHAGTVFRRCAAKRIILPSQIGSPDSRLYANDMICGCANLEYLDTSNCTIYTSSIGSDDMITNSGGYLSSLKIADLSGIESLYKLVLAYENGAGASPLSTIIIDRQNLNTWLRNNYVSIPYKPTKQVLLLVPANQIDIISNPDTGGNMYYLVQKCAAVDAIENYDIVHDYENGSITVTPKQAVVSSNSKLLRICAGACTDSVVLSDYLPAEETRILFAWKYDGSGQDYGNISAPIVDATSEADPQYEWPSDAHFTFSFVKNANADLTLIYISSGQNDLLMFGDGGTTATSFRSGFGINAINPNTEIYVAFAPRINEGWLPST